MITESFERIHRSNLVFMGVLPLQFKAGDSKASLGLDGTETFDIAIDDGVEPLQMVGVTAKKSDGTQGRVPGDLPHRYAGGGRLLP